jgi:hypothetical protein
VPYPRVNPHMAMAMAMAIAKKQKNNFWRKLRHKSDCCCFGWAVYAPWACYMDIRALYTTKPPKCALTCMGNLDLAADLVCVRVCVCLCVFVCVCVWSVYPAKLVKWRKSNLRGWWLAVRLALVLRAWAWEAGAGTKKHIL